MSRFDHQDHICFFVQTPVDCLNQMCSKPSLLFPYLYRPIRDKNNKKWAYSNKEMNVTVQVNIVYQFLLNMQQKITSFWWKRSSRNIHLHNKTNKATFWKLSTCFRNSINGKYSNISFSTHSSYFVSNCTKQYQQNLKYVAQQLTIYG